MPYLVIDPAAATEIPFINYGVPETAAQHPFGKSLSLMRARLVLELGRRTDIPDPMWNEWINDSYLDLFNSLELPEANKSFTFTTVVGQALYTLPSRVYTIRNLSITDPARTDSGGNLEKLDVFSYRKLPIRDGVPDGWLREQGMLVLWPTPDAEYPITVDARLQPMPLAADDDFPILEDKWHEIILRGGKARAWEAVQNDTKAALVTNSVVNLVQRHNNRDEIDNEVEYPSMRPVGSRRDLMALRRNLNNIEPGE